MATAMRITVQVSGQQWLVNSRTTDAVYVVRRIAPGRIQCDCLGTVYHGHCQHEEAVMDMLVNDGAERAARITALVAANNPLLRTGAA